MEKSERYYKNSRNEKLKEDDRLPFYEYDKDKELNKKIEANFDSMLSKLLDSSEFKKLVCPDFLTKMKSRDEYKRLSACPEFQAVVQSDDCRKLLGCIYSAFVLQDGIYPGYSDQDFKILFIGRDAYGLTGNDYSMSTYGKFFEKKRGGYKAFNKTILSIAYCLSQWKDTEIPKNIYKTIHGNPEELKKHSFACINVSKIDRHYGNWKNDEDAERVFIKVVGNELIKNQVDIINPKIIIGANLRKELIDVYGCQPGKEYDTYKNSFHGFEYKPKQGDPIPFLNSTKHFSDFKDEDISSFIENIKKYLVTKRMWPKP